MSIRNIDLPLLICFKETLQEQRRLALLHSPPSPEALSRVVVLRRHDSIGYFTVNYQGPKSVFECQTCKTRRVWGAIPEGPYVPEVEEWCKLTAVRLDEDQDRPKTAAAIFEEERERLRRKPIYE